MNIPLQVENICFHYPNNKGIKNISFELHDGEILCLFGKNGSGKSTLFKVLSTLIKPQAGNFFIYGNDAMKKRDKIRRYFFTVYDENAHFEFATGRENLDFFITTYKSDKREEIEKMSNDFNLDVSMKVCEYSYGMKRKLYLLEAFLGNTDLLFFDEPTLGLDSSSRDLFFKMLKKQKLATIIGTNRIEDVKFADRILLLEEGKLKEIHNIDSLLSSLITVKITTATDEITENISSIEDLPDLIEHYVKYHTIKRIDVIEDVKAGFEWTKEAIEKVERAPQFIRKMVYKIVEDHAEKRNIRRITPEVVEEARRRMEHR
jgi:ABC-2 type transport system ATP-binding protein